MKARKNPTLKQLVRRLRRPPDSPFDERFKVDPYWVLRLQKHPHSYAKRAFRDKLPIIREHTASSDLGEYACDAGELLLPAGSTWTEIEVEVRPELSEAAILTLKPRDAEYTVWDHDVRRFGVRVRKSGHMSYVVNYRIRYQKKLHKHTIGGVTEFSLEQAREVARDIRREARRGNDPIQQMREQAKGL